MYRASMEDPLMREGNTSSGGNPVKLEPTAADPNEDWHQPKTNAPELKVSPRISDMTASPSIRSRSRIALSE